VLKGKSDVLKAMIIFDFLFNFDVIFGNILYLIQFVNVFILTCV